MNISDLTKDQLEQLISIPPVLNHLHRTMGFKWVTEVQKERSV